MITKTLRRAIARPCARVVGTRGGFHTGYGKISASEIVLSGTAKASRFLAGADTVALPGFSWQADDDNGMYRIGVNNYGFAAAGIVRKSLSSAGMLMTVPVLLTDGTVGAPGLSFGSDTDVGLYRAGNNFMAASAGGSQVTTWQAGLFGSTQDLLMGAGSTLQLDPSASASDCPLQFSGDPNTGLNLVGADHMGLVSAGARMFSVLTTGVQGVNGVINVANTLRLGNGVGTQNITAVGNTITSTSSAKTIDPDANYTLTSVPTIDHTNHAFGDIIVIKNIDAAFSVTLQDESALAGSRVRGSGGANVVIGPRDVACFMYDGTDWLLLFLATV